MVGNEVREGAEGCRGEARGGGEQGRAGASRGEGARMGALR